MLGSALVTLMLEFVSLPPNANSDCNNLDVLNDIVYSIDFCNNLIDSAFYSKYAE